MTERDIAQRLVEYIDVQWCGSTGCLHRGSEHNIGNRCLICECEHFSARPRTADLATALKLAMA